mgnify:CR=1 FL=1
MPLPYPGKNISDEFIKNPVLSTLSLKELSTISSAGNSFMMISSYSSLLWAVSSSVNSAFLWYFLVFRLSEVLRSVWTIVGRGWICRHAEPRLSGRNNRLMDPLEELFSVAEKDLFCLRVDIFKF